MDAALFSQLCARSGQGVEALAWLLASNCPGDGAARRLPGIARFLLEGDPGLPELPEARPLDRAYRENLALLRDAVDWRRRLLRPEARRRRLDCGIVYEALIEREPVRDWGPVVLLTHALLSLVRPRQRAAVVVAMRDDGISLLEWIAHHRAVGFTGIFVYTNDNGDRSDPLLRLLAEHGVITLVDNAVSGTVSPQKKAFEHSLHFLPELRDYEWVYYADSDELLVPAAEFDHSVAAVLAVIKSQYLGRLPSAICYHWRWFVSDYAYARLPGLLLERFQHARPHPLFKSVVRLCDVLSMRILHFPDVFGECYFVDAGLDVVPASIGANRNGLWQFHGNDYRGGQINHYWCKSFEEFLVKKRRGDALAQSVTEFKRGTELFFAWNGRGSAADLVPAPPVLLARVQAELRDLHALDGVAAAAAEVDRAFAELVREAAAPRTACEVYRELIDAMTLETAVGAGAGDEPRG